METQGQTIGNRIRNYLASATLGAGLLLGGCGESENYENIDLPVAEHISQDLRQKYELGEQERKLDYESKLEEAIETFNESILDRKLTGNEQEKVYDLFKEAFKVRDSPGRELETPTSTQRLYDLIDTNLYGYDMGDPDLENALFEQGLNVDVSTIFSAGDAFKLVEFLGVFGIGALLCYSFNKRGKQ